MLLPALEAARESARSTSCINNLKQTGLLLHCYADDSNEIFPPAWTGAASELPVFYGNPGYWFDFLARGGYLNGWEQVKGSDNVAIADKNAKGPAKMFICPSDPEPLLFTHTFMIYSSYGCNNKYGETVASVIKRNRIRNSSVAVMIGDSWGDPSLASYWHGRISSGYFQTGRYPAHKFMNVLFFAGNVHSVRDIKSGYTWTLEN